MLAFKVQAGTEVKMIEHEKGYADVPGPFTRPVSYVTVKDAMFFREDLIVDPRGISKHACTPGDKVIGGTWAKAGYYGFSIEDSKRWYAVMVPANEVEVG